MALDVDGKRVKALREMRVMERRELAERCGLSYSTLYAIESNRRSVRAETARRLASVLGVEPGELVRRLKVVEGPRVVS